MSTAMPQVPPRPARSHDQKATTASSLGGDLPKVPPRPTHRRFDRSISPQRESFAPSPLNEIPPSVNHGNQNRTSLYSSESANVSTSDLPPRSSSVTLPTLGQEGSEYAEVFVAPEDPSSPPTQTRNVADDLKLHAPRPSLPTSSAKQRVSAVTRTDSGQAAAFGIGKAPGDDKDPVSRPLKAKASFASQTSNGPDRPPSSSIESEHGIPEIGQRVPMYPNAGDVQAPSPSPYQTTYPPGIGFHNDGSKPRHHTRKSSGRGTDIPFDAYGKHGHGQLPHDRFEKAYYEKHPELLKKETGHYHGPFAEDRPEWAMSSEDLNKIVRDTASRGAGLGTSPAVMGTPTEQIGFQASEEYTSRMSSPRPQSWVHHQAPSSTSQPHVDSPLRKESAAGNSNDKSEFAGSLSKKLESRASVGLESEAEDEDTIHVDAPGRRISKIYGGAGHLDSTEDLGPYAGNGEEDGIHDELGYGAPILASDEVAKEPFGWELQPAVSPLNESRANVYEEHIAFQRSGSASSSRTPSRPASIHGSLAGFRLPQETPLEALDEYEPLFPDGEEGNKGDVLNKRTVTAPGKLKRPELKNRKFPSQDIWEDTPNSLQYTATVSTPQLPEDKEEDPRLQSAGPGETPEQAFARRQEELAEKEAEEPESFLAREMQHDSYDLSESRSGMKQRFPSRDIWEDSPDSLQLQATVNEPKAEEQEAPILHSEKPSASTVTRNQEKDSAGLSPESEGGHSPAVIAAAMKPTVPARPTRSKQGSEAIETAHTVVPSRLSEKLKQTESASPALPAKPKPQVPARPSKPITRTSSDNIPLAKVPSDSSTKSSGSDQPAASKPKPPIPSRPVGSKIAALQSGFMMDLNKRLQLGPQAPKKEEPVAEMVEEEKEKGPLADARKGRARGPARRAPAKSPAPATSVAVTDKQTVTFGLCEPSTLWQIDPDRDLLVSAHQEEVASSLELKSAEPEVKPVEPESELPPSSIAEHVPDRPSDSAVVAEASTSQNSLVEDALAEQSIDAAKEVHPTDVEGDTLEDVKLKTEAAVISDNLPEPKAAGESIQTSTDTARDEGEEAEE